MTAVGVCGFGRCGSSMVMRMLDAGGVPPVAGSSSGSYELHGSADLARLTTADVEGHATKWLDWIKRGDVPAADWRFIWIRRTHREQARSQIKFLTLLAPELVRSTRPSESAFVRSYREDEPQLLYRLRSRGQLLTLAFEDTLASPRVTAARVADFLAPDVTLDHRAAAKVVQRRSPQCAPGLDYELSTLRSEP